MAYTVTLELICTPNTNAALAALKLRFPDSLKQSWYNMTYNCQLNDISPRANTEIATHCSAAIAADLGLSSVDDITSVEAFSGAWDTVGGRHERTVQHVTAIVGKNNIPWSFPITGGVTVYVGAYCSFPISLLRARP